MSLFRRRKKVQKQVTEWLIEPETAREIGAILFLVCGGLFLLALTGLAGEIGFYLAWLFRLFFGYLSYPFSLVFVFLGISLFFPGRIRLKKPTWLGLALLFLLLPALFHLFVAPDEALNWAREGHGGGFLGYGVSYLLKSLFGLWASFLIVASGFLISLMLLFSVTLSGLFGRFKDLFVRREQSHVEVTTGVPVLTMAPKKTPEQPSPASVGHYQLPPYELLENPTGGPTPGDVNKNIAIIAKTLAQFGISVTMSDVNVGPTVAQYTLKPAEGVKLSQITARINDLALALAAHPIRIEAPIPGKSLVGIEVPNQKRATVSLKEIFLSRDWRETRCRLPLALGRDVAGFPAVVNLEKMPHLLVAGSTGSGKTIFLNALILSLLFTKTPQELKFILIDPKRVEFHYYNDIPHLLAPVVVDLDKVVATLKWVVAEMERRYKVFQEVGKRDIEAYSLSRQERVSSGQLSTPPPMPYIVVIIDELADLMALAASEIEAQIVRIAQMARATGIHLILATQRPSVDVITGVIKANITARIAFAVASQIDSRTILDMAGAEKLLGSGDMLYQSSDIAKPRRIQAPFVREKEIKRVTEFLKAQAPEVVYNQEVTEYQESQEQLEQLPQDELYEKAKELVVEAQTASASLLQRRLRIGYTRAARLLDLLEEEGVIGKADGARPRQVLVNKDDLLPKE